MNDPARSFRRRLSGLLGGWLLAAAVFAALAWITAGEGRRAVAQLAGVELEASSIARQFRAIVDDCHGTLLRFGQVPPADSATALARHRAQLQDWLHARLSVADQPEARRALTRLNEEIEDYFRRLDRLAARPGGAWLPLSATELVAFDDASIRLQNLADEFAAAHTREFRTLLADSLGSVGRLRNLVFDCLGLLAVASVLLGTMIYRDMVRPLRARLVESETALAQGEKLAALGTLAAGVAHEIRNPLTAIKARLFTLQRALDGRTAREDLGAIQHEIERLEAIVRDVLGYARPAAPVLRELELTSWLRDLAAFLRNELETRAIRIELIASTPVWALADADQLRQVVLNLVRNADEAFEGRPGTVVLAAQVQRVALRGRLGDAAVLSVRDNGPGIPPEVQARLFDPFFTTKAAGTGLGLPIVARIVENHRGEMVFQTAPGKGTRFEVRLPLASAPALTVPAIRLGAGIGSPSSQ